jgi:hypothetical protein
VQVGEINRKQHKCSTYAAVHRCTAVCQSRCARTLLHNIEHRHTYSTVNGASALKRKNTTLDRTNKE